MSDATMRQAFIGAGANLGDRAETLRAAVARLQAEHGIEFVATSAMFETEPVGVTEQPTFLNLVIGVETTLRPEDLLAALLRIERDAGRVRAERWGPRTLDLDLLAFESETRATPALELPHPRMFERSFVLAPLREVLELPRFRGACWEDLRAKVSEASGGGRVRRLD